MANSTSKAVQQTAIYMAVAFVCMMSLVLSLMWVMQPGKIAALYAILRQLQTGLLWEYLPGGDAFLSAPMGSQPLTWVFTTSVPFGVLNFILILCMGFYAHDKVGSDHIRRYVRSDKPLEYRDVMDRMSWRYPANRFYLDHDLSALPVDRGIARMPSTAMEFLRAHDAIKGVKIDDRTGAPPTLVINRDGVRRHLVAQFGDRNPFAHLSTLTDRELIVAAVEDLDWHHVLIVYPALRRVEALHVDTDAAFAEVLKEMDDFFKKVWREVNSLKKRHGDGLILGYADDEDRALKQAAYAEMRGSLGRSKAKALPPEQITLRDALDADGPDFATVKEARRELTALLTDHIRLPAAGGRKNRLPSGIGDDGQLVRKVEGTLTPAEQEFYRAYQRKQKAAVADYETALLCNGFIGGMLTSVLSVSRKVGVVQPALFRWMRFYDRPLWLTLHNHGMNAPFVENAGVYEHIQAEELLGRPLLEPYVEKSIDGIIGEADVYLTPEVIREHEIIEVFRSVEKRAGQGLGAVLSGKLGGIRQDVDEIADVDVSDVDRTREDEEKPSRRRRAAFTRRA